MPSTNIILIGPMGAGKSTVGRMLARELGRTFVDSDHEVEARSGADIPWIFDVEGEEGFRQRERAVIRDLCQRRNIVLATGGGAVGSEENRQLLRSGGFIVYLKASVTAQIDRTRKDRKRPLLQRPDREQVLVGLLEKRRQYYVDLADLVLDTDRLSLRMLTRLIVEAVDNRSV